MYAEGETRTTEPAPTRDHSERMLKGFGYPVAVNGAGNVERGASLEGGTYRCACRSPLRPFSWWRPVLLPVQI